MTQPFSSDASVEISRLSCLTYNVWFGQHFFIERALAIIGFIKKRLPDFVALQEVTPAFLSILLNDRDVVDNYSFSDVTGSTVHPYGSLLLFRHPPRKLTWHQLESQMGRALVLGVFKLNGIDTALATVHLESLRFSAPVRTRQLRYIFAELAAFDQVFFMGDFNFCSSWAENKNIDSAYLDVWPAIRPSNKGYTEDTSVNIMRLNEKREEKGVRFDRILLRSKDKVWRPISIEILGTKPISDELPDVFPSDHFGLGATFEWQCTR